MESVVASSTSRAGTRRPGCGHPFPQSGGAPRSAPRLGGRPPALPGLALPSPHSARCLPRPTPSHTRSISGEEGCQRSAAPMEKLQQFIKIASCHSTPLTSTTLSHKHSSQPQGEVTKAGRWTRLPAPAPCHPRTTSTSSTLSSLRSPALPAPLTQCLEFLGWRRVNTHLCPVQFRLKGPNHREQGIRA